MRKKFFILTLLLTLVLTISSPVHAITWGTPDGTQHPHVVSLLFLRPDGYYICSGTLLTPYVVLTAGHCTEEGGQGNLGTWVRNDPNMDAAYNAERPQYPSLTAWINATWTAGQAVPHPQYADFAGFPNTHDVGLVLLSKPISVPLYGKLPTLGQFNFLDKQKGSPDGDRRFTIVGYGRQQMVPIPFGQNDWVRYVASTIVTNTQNTFTDGYNFQFSNSKGTGGGTCFGDSGGPAFWGTTNTVASVTSFGITNWCTGTDYSFRTDTAETLNFVTPYLSWKPTGKK